MRTVTTTLYLFDELPTDRAKERARDWWRELERRDPAWADAHYDSLSAALDALRNLDKEDPEAVVRAIKTADHCEATGYCDDALFADLLRKYSNNLEDLTEQVVRDHYARDWENDLENRMDADFVDENLRANEYEFTESGAIA